MDTMHPMRKHEFKLQKNDSNVSQLLERILATFQEYIINADHNVELYGLDGEPFSIEILHPMECEAEEEILENYFYVRISYFGSSPKF